MDFFKQKVSILAILRRNTYMNTSALGASHAPAELKKSSSESAWICKKCVETLKVANQSTYSKICEEKPVLEKSSTAQPHQRLLGGTYPKTFEHPPEWLSIIGVHLTVPIVLYSSSYK